jgi:septal ring factor EnvC (AmiA/AmiB activator)
VKRLWLLLALASGCAEELPAVQHGSRMRELTIGSCARLSWPVDAPISSGFGVRDGRPHDGIDLAAVTGTEVHAACDGVVAYAGEKLRGYGRLVILDHGGLATVYAHNSALLVREGQAVLRGGVIALSGQTGHATAPHVHFEVRRDSRPVDPLEYLDGSHRVAQVTNSRRPGLPQAGHSVQGRDAAPRPRPHLPALH